MKIKFEAIIPIRTFLFVLTLTHPQTATTALDRHIHYNKIHTHGTHNNELYSNESSHNNNKLAVTLQSVRDFKTNELPHAHRNRISSIAKGSNINKVRMHWCVSSPHQVVKFVQEQVMMHFDILPITALLD